MTKTKGEGRALARKEGYRGINGVQDLFAD